MTTTTQLHATASDVRKRYLNGSPVTVRPMTRRWISDVPSKIVKIFDPGFRVLVTSVCAGRCVYVSASRGRSRPFASPGDRSVLPTCSQPEQPTTSRVIDPAGLAQSQRTGGRCAVGNGRRRLRDDRVFLGSLPDGSPVFACPDHDLAEVLA